jgi:hypothetical protein
MPMEYEFHPLANIFPMMTDEETEALADDMLEHGQRESIALYDGKILDGRNRYRACRLKGIEPRFIEQRPADPAAFVASANLHRRHLDASQRAMIAANLATLRDGQRKSGASADAATQSDSATLLSVSRPSVQRARFVKDHGVPDLVTAVEVGEVSVSAAAVFANNVPPLDQARLIAEAGSAAAAVKESQPRVRGKADRAARRPPKSKPDVSDAADRAERAAAAKLAATAPEKLIDVIQHLVGIDITAVVKRMTDGERTALMVELVKANTWINKTAIDIATSGGAKLGKLAPKNLRFDALKFLREAATRIEAELANQVASEVSQMRRNL